MKPLLLALAVAYSVNAEAADPFSPVHFAPVERLADKTPLPPLPFRYVGRWTENGKVEVLLMRGERLYSLKAGDRIGDDYLIERIGDSSIGFTYLPLNEKQTLALPGLN